MEIFIKNMVLDSGTEETKSATSKENAVLSPHAVISSPVPLKQPSFNEQTNQKEENEDKLGKELRVDHDKDNVEDDAAKEMYIKRKTMESALNVIIDFLIQHPFVTAELL